MDKQKKDIAIVRKLDHLVLVDMNTCQKLIIKDESMLGKTDEELKTVYRDFGVKSKNARV